MNGSELQHLNWIKVKASGNYQCVEAAKHGEGVAVRDSKNPLGTVLGFTKAEWSAFLDGAKAGEFDHPLG